MKKARRWGLMLMIVMATVWLSPFAYAQGKAATPAQAKEQVKKMVAHVQAVGCNKAFADFNNPNASWMNPYSNVYSAAIGWDGVTLVYGMYPVLVGQNHLSVKDADGKLFVKDVIDKCMKSSPCQTNYRWMVTKTNKVESRTLLYEVVDCSGKKINVGVTYLGKP